MSQGNILKILEQEYPKELTSKEIALKQGTGPTSTSNGLRKLIEQKEVIKTGEKCTGRGRTITYKLTKKPKRKRKI